MNSDAVILTSLVTVSLLACASNLFWMICTQRLLNKLMSRNYHEYQMTESVAKDAAKPPAPKPQKVNQGPLEDLAVLAEFG